LNLEEIARVEVSSEDPQHPIEAAFKDGANLGWRASQLGEQMIGVDDCDSIPMLAGHLLDSGRVELRASPALPPAPLASTAIPARKLAFPAPSAAGPPSSLRDQTKARLKHALSASLHRRHRA
jgi:hypothetical protein